MSSRSSSPPFTRTATPIGDGCPLGYLLPPLAVIGIGALLLFFSLGLTVPSNPVGKPDMELQITTSLPLSPVFTPEVQTWRSKIQAWAAAAGLDPNLVATVMQIESCGDPQARSRSGAIGLFQVMPYHFTTRDDPYSPDTNALRGLDYLKRSLVSARGNVRLTFAGYNGGIGVIDQPENSWATETKRYSTWGTGIYSDATSGMNDSPRLQEWLATSGASLCIHARTRLGISP